MPKYLYDPPIQVTPSNLPVSHSEPCDTCRCKPCEFEPKGADCINRKSVFADSDFYNYDWYQDNRHELAEEFLRRERDYNDKLKGTW